MCYESERISQHFFTKCYAEGPFKSRYSMYLKLIFAAVEANDIQWIVHLAYQGDDRANIMT